MHAPLSYYKFYKKKFLSSLRVVKPVLPCKLLKKRKLINIKLATSHFTTNAAQEVFMMQVGERAPSFQTHCNPESQHHKLTSPSSVLVITTFITSETPIPSLALWRQSTYEGGPLPPNQFKVYVRKALLAVLTGAVVHSSSWPQLTVRVGAEWRGVRG